MTRRAVAVRGGYCLSLSVACLLKCDVILIMRQKEWLCLEAFDGVLLWRLSAVDGVVLNEGEAMFFWVDCYWSNERCHHTQRKIDRAINTVNNIRLL